MLLQWLRLWRRNGSTFTELSLANQDDAVNTVLDLGTSEFLYFASHYPANNFFWHSHVAQSNAASMAIEYWDGVAWRAVTSVIDGTQTGTASLAKSGVVQFIPHRLYKWNRVADTSETSGPSELTGLEIYDHYWFRISFSGALSGTTAFKKIGYAFTMSQQLAKHDVEIDRKLTSFATGKTDWWPEIMNASEMLVADLRRMGVVISRGQVLLFDDVSLACEMKTLSNLYFSLGKAYDEKRKVVDLAYEKALNMRYMSLDTNEDAMLDLSERNYTTKTLAR